MLPITMDRLRLGCENSGLDWLLPPPIEAGQFSFAVFLSFYVGLTLFKLYSLRYHPYKCLKCLRGDSVTLALVVNSALWGWLHGGGGQGNGGGGGDGDGGGGGQGSSWWRTPLAIAVALLDLVLILDFIRVARLGVSLSRQRVVRWRRGALRNKFCLSFTVNVAMFLVGMPEIVPWSIATFFMRNSAIYGVAVFRVLRYYLCKIHPSGGHINWVHFMMVEALWFVAGTAETGRDTRLVSMLGGLVETSFAMMCDGRGKGVDLWDLLFLTALAHTFNWYSKRGRITKQWRGAISFLRLSAIRRRRARDPTFVLQRRQDMPSCVYGDPHRAHTIVVVSHAWLGIDEADPDGYHLDLTIQRLEEHLCPYERRLEGFMSCPSYVFEFLQAAWWRYYYYEAEADVLIFFDMSSLYQKPRSSAQDRSFQRACDLMSNLYSHFDVLVIPEIPGNVTYFDRNVGFFEKGWCWFEVVAADLGNKLRISPGILDELALERAKIEEMKRRTKGNLSSSLWGWPPYPPDLLARSRQKELLAFRDTQEIRGKVFTCGKADLDRVSKQLRFFQACQELKGAVLEGNAERVRKLLDRAQQVQQAPTAVSAIPSQGSRGDSKDSMANVVFDGSFTTPLHLAVRHNCTAVVEVLLSYGSIPRRDFRGDFAWEAFGFPRWSAAARAARGWRPVADSTSTRDDSVELSDSWTVY